MGFLITAFASIGDAQTKNENCYFSYSRTNCTPAQRSAKMNVIAHARTAAVTIKATRSVSCGDGSPDSCIAADSSAISIIQKEVDASELWQDLTKVEAKKADLLLQFKTSNRDSLDLCVFDGESNDLLWCDARSPVVALDNDVFREITHFLHVRQVAMHL